MLTRRSPRAVAVLSVVALLTVAAGGAAHADNLSNSLDSSIDAVAEVMPLNVGGVAGTTTLYVSPTNNDGKQGCNLTGSRTLSVSVASDDTAVATVSPSSFTFTACGDTKTVTVTPVSQGTATVAVTQTANSTEGTFTFSGATFTVNVAPPANTAPLLSVGGVVGGASYDQGSVPTATCLVTDAEDGSSSFAASLSPVAGAYAADGIGSQTASCSYTDAGGLTASASETYGIGDPTAPVISYTLDPATPDGDNGWYTADAVLLTWTVTEPQSPSSVVKVGCVDQSVTADQAPTEYTCSATSAGGAATGASVTIQRDTEAPSVSSTSAVGSLGLNGWYTSAVTATFTGTDTLSGPLSQTLTATSSGEGAAVSVLSPAFSDLAGNTSAVGAATESFKIDLSGPIVTHTGASPAPNAAGWNNSDVTATFTGTDGISGPASVTKTVTSSGEGAAVVVSSPAFSDVAGNTTAAGAASASFRIDKTAPAVSPGVVTAGAAGANGWYTTDVTATFTGTDTLSGLIDPSQQVTTSGEGSIVIQSPAFTDRADNTRPAGATGLTVDVDKTDPTATFDGSIGSVYFGSVPAAPGCTATDDVSGPAGCVVTGYSAAVGNHTLTATATDNAGRTSTATQTYTVKAWTTKGFYQPVDMGGVLNAVKGGSTVPVKFELFAGTTELTDTDLLTMSAKKVVCTSGAPLDDIEMVASGSTSLRYDSTGGQFIYNWKTPTGAGSCYQLLMTADDGSTLSALFRLK